MSKKFLLVFCVCVLTLFTGCLEQFYTIKVKEDLSGTYAVTMKMDLDQMAKMVYNYMKATNPQQVQGMTEDQYVPFIKATITGKAQQNLEMQKQDLKKKLPKGIGLIKFDITTKDQNQMITSMVFSFDHVRSLVNMNDMDFSTSSVPQNGGGMGGMGAATNKGPKFKFEVEETDSFIIIKEKGEQEEDVSPEQLQMAEAMMPGATDAMKSMTANLAFYVPKNYRVVEQTSDKQKKGRFYWSRRALADSKDKSENIYLKLKKK